MIVTSLVRIAVCMICFLTAFSCANKEEKTADTPKKLAVVTTLFPNYDFAKNIGGQYAEVTLLLPPGIEAHGFEPRPEDIVKITKADVFIYTGKHMEPWAEDLLKGIDNKKLVIVDASAGISFIQQTEDSHHEADTHGHDEELDPHIWLDFLNAGTMADNIFAGLAKADAAHQDQYGSQAVQYKAKLNKLDKKYKEGLSVCKSRVFIHGGHFTFGYLAKRYNLKYHAAYEGFSPNAEPGPKRLMELTRNLKKNASTAVFYEELLSPKMAETIARETGAALLPLHAGHNISKEDLDRGATFISLMEQTLAHLRTGLQCK